MSQEPAIEFRTIKKENKVLNHNEESQRGILAEDVLH